MRFDVTDILSVQCVAMRLLGCFFLSDSTAPLISSTEGSEVTESLSVCVCVCVLTEC